MEIFVVVINEVYDMETFDDNVKVFHEETEATKYLNDQKESALHDYREKFEEEDIGFTENDYGFEVYEDGCYSEFHVTGQIYKFAEENGTFKSIWE